MLIILKKSVRLQCAGNLPTTVERPGQNPELSRTSLFYSFLPSKLRRSSHAEHQGRSNAAMQNIFLGCTALRRGRRRCRRRTAAVLAGYLLGRMPAPSASTHSRDVRGGESLARRATPACAMLWWWTASIPYKYPLPTQLAAEPWCLSAPVSHEPTFDSVNPR